MVDPIGPKGSTPADLRVVPVISSAVTPKVVSATTPDRQASPVAQLASQLAAQPPVDADRVARIKRAIADGTFPILPATIADSLIALKFDWMSHDPA